MKLAIYEFINSLMELIIKVTFIWTIVLFIIYLVKDIPFNFTSLIIYIIALVISTTLDIKIERMNEIVMTPKKMTDDETSEFKKKLEEYQEKLRNQKIQI